MEAASEKPRRRSGVFYWRDLFFEGIYRVLEAFGMRFEHRPRGESRFENMLERFYRRLPLEGCAIVDIGAHFGRHALPLARAVGPSGVVHAFEPLPIARGVLADRIAKGGHANIVLHACALGASTGEAPFVVVGGRLEESGLRERAMYNEPKRVELKRITVEVKRLDDAIPPELPVRFIKIDVEGGELDALRGATGTLDRHRPVVAFECGAAAFAAYHESSDELFTLFASRGYSVHSITGLRVADAAHFRELTTRQDFWDYVALPAADADLARHLQGLEDSPEDADEPGRRAR